MPWIFSDCHFEDEVAEVVEIIQSPESTQIHKLIEGIFLCHHQNDGEIHDDGRVDYLEVERER